MTFIDGTVVNVVLPLLGERLHATSGQLQWVVEAYMLILTALVLLGGSLGDRYGRRRVFVIGTVLFAAASAWCGLSSAIAQLIVARAVQGAGAALLVPSSLSLISATFSDHDRGAAIGTWAAGTSIAAGAGPILGSWLVEHLSWRWVFLINLPIAVLVLAIAATSVRESGGDDPSARQDWIGAALAAVGLGALVFGLVRAGAPDAIDVVTQVAIAAGVIGLLVFVLFERYLDRNGGNHAMMPLRLFASPTFSGVNLLTLFLYAALAIVMFVLPFALIDRHGYSVVSAASAMLPFVIVMFTLSRWAGQLMDRYGPRLPLVAGPLTAAAGFTLMTRATDDGRYLITIFPAVMVMSIGMAISVAPLTTTVMAAVDARHAGVASGINNAVARLASVLAVGLVGLIAPDGFAAAIGKTSWIAAGMAAAGALCAALLVPPRMS